MRLLILVAALVALLIGDADAALYRGETGQGRVASLRTGADGLPKRARVIWQARCSGGGVLRDDTVSRPPFDSVTADRLLDGGSYVMKDPGGIRIRIHGRLRLERNGQRWTGRFVVRAIVRKRGKEVGRCRARTPVRLRRV